MRELTMSQADDLYELITERAGRSIIATSNRSPADWYPLFANPVVAESILDRLLNSAHHVAMPGRSYRPQQPAGREHRQQRVAVVTGQLEHDSPGHTQAGPAQQRCARPGCPQPVARNPRGRPRLYCTPSCRAQAHRQRPPDAREPLVVEVDHASTSSRGRPTGHIWLIRLRRGHHRTIVAVSLGRPSAEHLARQLRDVIDPPALATPANTR